MLQAIVNFFKTPPPALDPLFVPWVAALIGGNIIIITALWALAKYVAKKTPWAHDDEVIQIVTGAVAAVKDAVSSVKKKPEEIIELTEVAAGEEKKEPEVCEKCGSPLDLDRSV